MKKVCLYILIIFITAESTSFDQFLKLPVLFEHFREHQERDRNVDLLEFLSMHYWGQDIKDNDDARDMQLPFRKVNINSQQILFVSFTRTSQIKETEQTLIRTFTVYKDQYHPDPNLTSPFRPPCA